MVSCRAPALPLTYILLSFTSLSPTFHRFSTFPFPIYPIFFLPPLLLPFQLSLPQCSIFIFPFQPSSFPFNLPLSIPTFHVPTFPLPYISLSLPISFPTYLLHYLSISLPTFPPSSPFPFFRCYSSPFLLLFSSPFPFIFPTLFTPFSFFFSFPFFFLLFSLFSFFFSLSLPFFLLSFLPFPSSWVFDKGILYTPVIT